MTAELPQPIYIAGPMTGLPAFNFPAFEEAAAALRSAGYAVVSPREIGLPCGCIGLPPQCGAIDHDWTAFVRSDLRGLLDCAAVALLPGWETSRGATLERHVAKALNMDVEPLSVWLERAS